MNTIKVSNSLDPNKAQHLSRLGPTNVGPDIGPIYMQMLSSDNTNIQTNK